MRDEKLIDVAMQVHVKTAKAVLASGDGDKNKAIWLPLSQIEMEPTKTPNVFTITMPQWLAEEKGLI